MTSFFNFKLDNVDRRVISGVIVSLFAIIGSLLLAIAILHYTGLVLLCVIPLAGIIITVYHMYREFVDEARSVRNG